VKVKSFKPLKGKIFVTELDEGVHRTRAGIIIQDDIGSANLGIRARWGKVAYVGEDVDSVTPGEWVLIAHGRWTQRVKLDIEDEGPRDIWMVDPEAILVASDEYHGHERIKFT
jgi:hypothetical protein